MHTALFRFFGVKFDLFLDYHTKGHINKGKSVVESLWCLNAFFKTRISAAPSEMYTEKNCLLQILETIFF